MYMQNVLEITVHVQILWRAFVLGADLTPGGWTDSRVLSNEFGYSAMTKWKEYAHAKDFNRYYKIKPRVMMGDWGVVNDMNRSLYVTKL